MDSEELARVCAKLSLTEEDEPMANIGESISELVDSVGINLFVFQFKCPWDRKQILEGGLWAFDKNLLVLKEASGVGRISDVNLNLTPFWIQLHNLPLACMCREVGLILGGLIGKMIEIDGGSSGSCLGKFIRVRVMLDVSKPLLRGLRVKVGYPEEICSVVLCYEKLPNFCYFCGKLGHHVRECSDNSQGILNEENWRFGVWMRALAPFGGRNKKNSDDSSREEVSIGGTFSRSAGDQPKADTEGFRQVEQVVVDVSKNKEFGADLQVKQHVFDMGGKNSDTAGAASTSRRAVTDSLINKNEVKIGAAALPDSDSIVVQINESRVSSFTGKGVVFTKTGDFEDGLGKRVADDPVEEEGADLQGNKRCKGLGNPRTFRSLRSLLRGLCPSLVFLSETRLDVGSVDRLKNSLCFEGGFEVARVGLSDGLLLLWKDDIDVEIKSFSKGHIDSVINDAEGGRWRFTGFYGEPKQVNRGLSWTLLRRLGGLFSLSWLVGGDFNEIVSDVEKSGGSFRGATAMSNFRSAINDCCLIDMGFQGNCFIWSNRQSFDQCIQERLDRSLCTLQWRIQFPKALDCCLIDMGFQGNCFIWSNRQSFDQCIQERLDRSLCTLQWRIQFPKALVRHLDYESSNHRALIVENISKKGFLAVASVLDSVGRVTSRLQIWNRDKRKKATLELKKLRGDLKELMGASRLDFSLIKSVEKKIDLILQDFEVFWRQRSRAPWLRAGDRNSKFFHAKASQRRRRNCINGLIDERGFWRPYVEDIQQIISDYFGKLFSSSSPSPSDFDNVLQVVGRKVSNDMNLKLGATFTKEEVRFLEVLNENAPMGGLGKAVVVLIPKVKTPVRIEEFRPISLCNVLYKLIAKVLANRLKLVLDDVISPSQSAFVPGRLILDNIVVAYECLHHLRNSRSGSKGHIALKLDMSKAYDRVEWGFLQKIMKRLGFSLGWISKVMGCVSSASYAFLVNGEPRGLLAMLDATELGGWIHGVKVSKTAPLISHLLFADDSLIFWWGSYNNRKKSHWLVWRKMCLPKAAGDMGFKDIMAFNQAMLAKQGWRILSSPSSLLARVLKARYFPSFSSFSFLDSKVGRLPSFTWRSILWGRDVLLKGLRWKIEGVTVSALLQEPGFWHVDIVRRHFIHEEADLILSLPLSLHPRRDSFLWHFDSRGLFSVRSAYKVALGLQQESLTSSSKGALEVWKHLWKLDVPNKFKVFAWRACKKILPTNLNLSKKGIPVSHLCSFCGLASESSDHALWGCSRLKSVWYRCPFAVDLKRCRFVDFLSRIEFIFAAFPVVCVRQFVVSCWLLWRDKNVILHDGRGLVLDQVWNDADSFIDDFLAANLPPASSPFCSSFGPDLAAFSSDWKASPAIVFKLNVDASCDVLSGCSGLGMVVRNATGLAVFAAAVPLKFCTDVEVAYARAILAGIQLTVQRGLLPLLVETDSLNVSRLCNGDILSRSDVENIIFDIQSLMSSLNIASISFISRLGNDVAHGIAKKTFDLDVPCLWICSFPFGCPNCSRLAASSNARGEEGLFNRGFEVMRLNTYTTDEMLCREKHWRLHLFLFIANCGDCAPYVPVHHVDQMVLKQALSAPVVAVASPSAVRAWVNLISESEQWSNSVACIGETTASAAKNLGLRNVYYPTHPGLEGWVDSILEALKAHNNLYHFAIVSFQVLGDKEQTSKSELAHQQDEVWDELEAATL
ncbi:hypothetical protein JRO89_XSUnG0053100 [Xanthoceras sorbifolium]|uniref:Uroporphyrinogen-III synthase n=1 Tax=Xanthoceras sorbifolium TaxID=99658 RepID=A0ABQ8GZW4_9ROSI|nr:hypothetical protein JRO89_XSUnG0053100 [Xanthoceras sorbifolium]